MIPVKSPHAVRRRRSPTRSCPAAGSAGGGYGVPRRPDQHGRAAAGGARQPARRARHGGGRDRQAAADDPTAAAGAIRAAFGDARRGSAATGARRRRAVARDCAGASTRSDEDARRTPAGATQPRCAAAAPAALRGDRRYRRQELPVLRRPAACDRRRRLGDARRCAGSVSGQGDPAPAVWLPRLRGCGGAGAGAGAPADRRHRHRGGAGAGAGSQVFRASAALPPGAGLRPPRHRPRPLHFGKLGRTDMLVAAAAGRVAARHDPIVAEDLRRRHAGAGARSRARAHQDRSAVGLCPR